jgi:hypothetical protein
MHFCWNVGKVRFVLSKVSLFVVGGYGTILTTSKFKFGFFFFSTQPYVGVDIKTIGNVCSNIIFGDVALPPPPPSSANHGLSMDLHPSICETTPQSIVLVGNPVEPSGPKKKKPKKTKWEINQIFQHRWAARFVWFELVCVADGKMKMVRCKICSQIEGRKKLLVPKLNSLIKHLSLRKCLVTRLGIVVWEYFLSPSNAHVKNEKVYGTIRKFSVID